MRRNAIINKFCESHGVNLTPVPWGGIVIGYDEQELFGQIGELDPLNRANSEMGMHYRYDLPCPHINIPDTHKK
jgi:hypothetical protein